MTTEPWEQDVPIEVAPVRAGEELPWDRLEAYLRPQLDLPGDPRVGYAQVYGAPGVGCATLLST